MTIQVLNITVWSQSYTQITWTDILWNSHEIHVVSIKEVALSCRLYDEFRTDTMLALATTHFSGVGLRSWRGSFVPSKPMLMHCQILSRGSHCFSWRSSSLYSLWGVGICLKNDSQWSFIPSETMIIHCGQEVHIISTEDPPPYNSWDLRAVDWRGASEIRARYVQRY